MMNSSVALVKWLKLHSRNKGPEYDYFCFLHGISVGISPLSFIFTSVMMQVKAV